MYEPDRSTPGLPASWFPELESDASPSRGRALQSTADSGRDSRVSKNWKRLHRAAKRRRSNQPVRQLRPIAVPSREEFRRSLGDTTMSDSAIDEFYSSIRVSMRRTASRITIVNRRRRSMMHCSRVRRGHERRSGSNARSRGSRRASSRGGDSGDADGSGEPDLPAQRRSVAALQVSRRGAVA